MRLLRFVKDILIFNNSPEEAINTLEDLEEVSLTMFLKINFEKTKLMFNSFEFKKKKIIYNKTEIKKEQNYACLLHEITSDNSIMKYIKSRIRNVGSLVL